MTDNKVETEVEVINKERIEQTVRLREVILSTGITVISVWFASELIEYLLAGCSNSKFDYIFLAVALLSSGISIYNLLISIKDYIKSKFDTN